MKNTIFEWGPAGCGFYQKQLGKKAAVTTIWMSAIINLIAALYFQLVVLMPAQSGWADKGGQAAWQFLFGIIDTSSGVWWQAIFSLQLRIVIGSIITMVIAELVDTQVYHQWTSGIGKDKPEWTRVFVSNAFSIPVDSILFPFYSLHRDCRRRRDDADVRHKYNRQGDNYTSGLLDDIPGAREAYL